MTVPVLCLLLFIGQVNASEDVVRLPQGSVTISQDYGGKLVELFNAPADVFLPSLPQSARLTTEWSVDIKNLGPHNVSIRNQNQLTVLLRPNESATIAARGSSTFVRLR